MKMFKLLAVFISVLGFVSTSAHGREFADIYTDCGLGALIAPTNDAVAAVTNVTFDLGTTAISSNASSEDTCNGGKEKAAAYIYKSYASLENDLAKGNGEHLSALYNMMSCSSNSRQQLTGALRKDFSEVVSRADYASSTRYEKSEVIYDMVTTRINATSGTTCNIV